MAEPITEQQTAPGETVVLRVPSTMKSLVETLIFAADEPLTVKEIKAIYEQQGPGSGERHIEQEEIQQIVGSLNQEYQKADRGYRIIAIAGGYQFATMQEYAEWIGRLYKEQGRRKLSQSSLESLAIIAYKQPITKPEIESIRGVNCDYVLKTLLEKDLVTIVGRADTVGRPLLYGTTREFLKHFGLNDITDLPRPREIEEILGESEFETERRMLEAQAGADQTKKEEEDFKSRLPHIPKKKPEMDESVHIVPRKRSRNLTIRPAKESEGQEQLEIQPGQAGPTERPAVPFSERAQDAGTTEEPAASMEESGVEIPGTVEAVEMSAEPLVAPETPPVSQNSDRPSEGVDEAQQTPVLANEAHSSDFDSELSPHPFTQAEPELPQPRRSRWATWKQTLQKFIRKLFD